MVAIQSRLDDILLATKGKKVEATHTITRSIPGICTEDGKAKRLTLDVSAEGEREIKKLDAQFKKLLGEAGAVYAKLQDARVEARAAKPRVKKPEATPETDGGNAGQAPQTDGSFSS